MTASVPPGGEYRLSAGPYMSGELSVLSFEGREQVNGLYDFDVICWAKDHEELLLQGALLGLPASLLLHLPGGAARSVHGVVRRVKIEGKHQGGRHAYRLSIVPRLWLLGKRVGSRIFQDRTALEVVALVLGEHAVPYELRVLSRYPSRQYCVQYQESDLDFVLRLLAEEGIFFWFEQPEVEAGAGERVVLADRSPACPAIAGDPALVYRPQTGDGALRAEEDHVLAFHLQTRVEPSSVVLRDYDFRRPLLDLTSRATAPPDAAPPLPRALEVYEHHGEYEETDADLDSAAAYLEQLRAGAREAEAKSLCRRLLPGHRFELHDHEIEALDAAWVVTWIEHRGVAPEVAPAGVRVYENRFRCVPAEVPCRPPRPPRVTRQVIESAVVVGPEGQEIFTDGYGRIKIQFHWDRDGARSEQSSCWIRVMQAWAGTGFGSLFIPRIGMEVVVSFLGGDLDRPVVMGCLYNAANPVPHGLPAASTRSGLRTRSSPNGGGFNELTFDDRAGAEQIYMRAQRDLDEEVGRDLGVRVSHDAAVTVGHDLTTKVQGDRRDETAGDQQIRVGGGRSAEILGPERSQIGGARKTTVEGPDELQVKGPAVAEHGGDRTVRVKGNDVARVLGGHTLIVEGRDELVVQGAARVTYSSACSVNAAQGLSLTVGSKKSPASVESALSGDLVLRGDGSLEISAGKQIRLRVGSTVVTLLPKELRIDAETITLSGKSITAKAEKSALSLGKSVEIKGDAIAIASKDNAILELDKEAKLDGDKVKIKPGLSAELQKRDEREEQREEADKVTVHLFDLAGELIRGALYEVSFPGYFDDGAAADGTVEIPVFPDVETARLKWGRPKDQREDGGEDPYEFDMEVYLQTAADDPDEAVRRKLHNLGHQGSLHEAVRHYQDSLGVARTGRTADIEADLGARHDGASPVKLGKA
ncbi:MAG: type VI secretion system tip protein TssI/VgrG [Byssovorax sp.]